LGRVVLSGCWGVKDDKVKYNIYHVHPVRFFANLAAAVPMATIAK
jgi:hypothetical protein